MIEEFLALRMGHRLCLFRCLCAARWKEALDAGMAPRVVLRATHRDALLSVSLDELKRHALDLA